MDRENLAGLIESWENLSLLVKDIGNFPEHLDILMDIALNSSHPNSWRAAWMADRIHDQHPDLIKPYIPAMIEKLRTESQTGKKRHFLKLVSLSTIPDEFDSFLINYCLNAMTSDREPPAVRVHAMQTLFNISEKLPDLKTELIFVIENEIEFHPTPGILTRGRKLIGKLQKQLRS